MDWGSVEVQVWELWTGCGARWVINRGTRQGIASISAPAAAAAGGVATAAAVAGTGSWASWVARGKALGGSRLYIGV